jgi:predicted metalloprotease with PDZ domain
MTFFFAQAEDGEAFTRSAAFTSADSVIPEGRIVWGNFLAHELFHFWNGQRIRGAGPRTTWRWMAEGFTEYYANVTLAREGLISSELFLKKAERHMGSYLYFMTAPAFPRMSLAEAGMDTGVNRFGVYDGGWAVAFCLDGLIREGSGDRRSLDDFMRELWLRFGPGSSGYSVRELDGLAEELAGNDLGGFVATYVESDRVLPVRECLDRVGLIASLKSYAAEAFLFTDAGASTAAVLRGRALYGARSQ